MIHILQRAARQLGRKLRVLSTAMVAFSVGSAFAQAPDSSHRQSTHVYHTRLEDAPASARSRSNPFEGNPQEAKAGGKLFEQHCSECHGEKADGTRHAPSLLQPEVQEAPPGALFWLITNGVVRHGMPVWSKLPEAQRWQIITFVKSLGMSSTRISQR